MTIAVAIASTTGVPAPLAASPAPIVTEASRPGAMCLLRSGVEAAGDGVRTGSKRPMLPGARGGAAGTPEPGNGGA